MGQEESALDACFSIFVVALVKKKKKLNVSIFNHRQKLRKFMACVKEPSGPGAPREDLSTTERTCSKFFPTEETKHTKLSYFGMETAVPNKLQPAVVSSDCSRLVTGDDWEVLRNLFKTEPGKTVSWNDVLSTIPKVCRTRNAEQVREFLTAFIPTGNTDDKPVFITKTNIPFIPISWMLRYADRLQL